MDKLYERSVDLHVRKTFVYAETDDAYAYSDADATVKIPAVVLEDMFLKGLVVIDGVASYSPVSFSVAEGVGTLTYVKADAQTATTAVLATLKSEEYEAQ